MYVSREERNGLTKEYLHTLFEYRDGGLYWKIAKTPRVRVGCLAGKIEKSGYILIGINNTHYPAHRIVWLMLSDDPLPENVDHKDTNRQNNRIENLRAATTKQNRQNSKLPITNTSGFKGVHWHKRHKKWHVSVWVGGKQRHFGAYDDIELAELVAIEAREKYHGEFARHS